MGSSRIPKTNKIYRLRLVFFSMILCLSTKVHGWSIQQGKTDKNFTTILQKIEGFSKLYSLNKRQIDQLLKDLAHQRISQSRCSQTGEGAYIATNTSKQATAPFIGPTEQDEKNSIILDKYEKICYLYAYDPLGQAWVQIKFFKIIASLHNGNPIDLSIHGKPYTNFWAYDPVDRSWHKVSLIPYLQQTNTQINNDSPTMATKQSVLPDQNNLLHDPNVATDELLEELLGVHTSTTHPGRKSSIWTNWSFDLSIGTGAVFYTNRLVQMQLLHRQKNNNYFFITKTNRVYKPNWFGDRLTQVNDFDRFDGIEEGNGNKSAFKGNGMSIPITLGLQYTFCQKLFVGVGGEMVFNLISPLVHNDENIKDKLYPIDGKWSTQGRWFAKCGWYAFANEKHRLFADIRLFYVYHLGSMCSRLYTFGPYLHRAPAFNVGLGYEQQLTDYLSYTARLSMEHQQFNEFKKFHDYNIAYSQPAIYLQMGLSIRPTKYDPSVYTKNAVYQNKKDQSNGTSKLEGLQELLDLD